MQEIYFDNSSTTRCHEKAVEAMVDAYRVNYGNPSAMHMMGVRAENLVKEARATIASTLKAKEGQILFTSGGTESNNLSLVGGALAKKRTGRHLITCAVEHAAVREPMKRLAEEGYELTVLPVDEKGMISLSDLEAALRPDTALVSLMMVNNEVGTIQPIEEAAKIIHAKGEALFHVDAIQAYAKMAIYPGKMGIDLLSASGHKFHGPKGVGFLYIGEKARVIPQILGGGQQGGLRSGTENVPGAVGMGVAAGLAYGSLEENRKKLYALKEQLAEGFLALPDVFLNGPEPLEGAPQILNASFVGVRAEVLLHALEEKGIYVSAGSACSSHKKKPSGTLVAMGLPEERRESALRFSFSVENTPEEVEEVLKALGELLPVLRRFRRK